MLKSIKLFLKNKRTYFTLLAILIIIGIIMPQITHASWASCIGGGTAGGVAAGAVVGSFFPGVGTLIGAGVGAFAGCWALDWGSDAVEKGISHGVGNVAVTLSGWAIKVSSYLFEQVGGLDLIQKPITKDATVLAGWEIVRNFANMFVVLGFVVIGLATILRLREYEAQKRLIPLIIVALLINFSLLFCGIIIDASNITIKYFTQVSGPAGITQPIMDAVQGPATMSNLTLLKTGNSGDFLITAIGVAAYGFLSAMIFFIYALLFLFRYVALMLLVILSPLGFVCYVFPITQPIFKKWWEQFFQWCIIGIPASFFIYLAGHIIANGTTTTNIAWTYWIPAIFLMFAYSLVFQTSAIGAGAVMGLATGAVGFAAGTVRTVGGRVAGAGWNLAGRTDAGRNLRERLSNAGNRIAAATGFAPEGRPAQQRAERAATNMKLVTALRTGTAGERGRYEQLVRTGTGSLGASAVAHANEKGDLDRILGNDQNRIRQRVGVATSGYGYETKAFVDKHHWMAGDNEDRVTRELTALPAGATRAQAVSSVNRKQLENSWGGMSTEARAGVDLSAFHANDAEEFILNRSADDLKAFRYNPRGHSNRTAITSQIPAINAGITAAHTAGDTNRERRLREVLGVANTM